MKILAMILGTNQLKLGYQIRYDIVEDPHHNIRNNYVEDSGNEIRYRYTSKMVVEADQMESAEDRIQS